MNGRRLLAMLAAVFALTLVSAACSSSDNSGGGSGTGSASGAPSDTTITVKDFQFDPSTIDVSSGATTISITNTGTVVHSFGDAEGRLTSDPEAATD